MTAADTNKSEEAENQSAARFSNIIASNAVGTVERVSGLDF
jgi:hypothetical protein